MYNVLFSRCFIYLYTVGLVSFVLLVSCENVFPPPPKLLIILLIRDMNIYYFLCLASIFVSLFLYLNIISRTFKISSMINVK